MKEKIVIENLPTEFGDEAASFYLWGLGKAKWFSLVSVVEYRHTKENNGRLT